MVWSGCQRVGETLDARDVGGDDVPGAAEDVAVGPVALDKLGLPLQQVHDVVIELNDFQLQAVAGGVEMLGVGTAVRPDHVSDREDPPVDAVDLVLVRLPVLLDGEVPQSGRHHDQAVHDRFVALLVDHLDRKLSRSGVPLLKLQVCEVLHEELEASLTFRDVGGLEVVSLLVEDGVSRPRHDATIEFLEVHDGLEDDRVKDLDIERDVAKEAVAAFISDLAEGLDGEQTIGMEVLAGAFSH